MVEGKSKDKTMGVGIYGSGDGSITKRTATQKRASNRKPFQVMLLTLNND